MSELQLNGNGQANAGTVPSSKPPRDWKALERHPLSAAYVNLDGPEWDAFVGCLRLHGIVNDRKITLYEGKVLDGFQLLRGCIEADIKPKFQQLPDGIDPEVFVEVMNDRRRHEDAETIRPRAQARRERVAAARREDGKSLAVISEEENVSIATVRRDLEEASTVPGGTVEPADGEIQGKDGRKRAANKVVKRHSSDNTQDDGALLDSLDQPVPPGLVPVFNKVKAFRDIVNQLTAINQELAILKQSPAGACMHLQQAQTDLRNLKETVRFDMPYAVCPVCKGNAKARRANCPCKQRGWFPEEPYKNLPAEYRQ